VRFLIACGGTGGHFYPGYALGKALRRRGHEVLFVLRAEDPAGPRLAAEDLPFTELDVLGLPRRPSLEWAAVMLKLAGSLRVARNIVFEYRPGAAVAMGGYLSVPVCFAAAWAGVPLLLHESNSVLGLANRLCLPLADELALGLPLKKSPASSTPMRLAGTPVREELWTPWDPAAAREGLGLSPERATVLAFGGSQGARSINLSLPAALARLRRAGADLQVLHLSGKAGAEEVERLYKESDVPARVLPYLDAMHLAYAAADVVVCRSGAATLAELAAQSKPALLIPYPSAAAAHQEANASVFVSAGAARMLKEPVSPESVSAALGPMLEDRGALAAMSEAYKRLGLPGARDCVRVLADLAEKAAGGRA